MRWVAVAYWFGLACVASLAAGEWVELARLMAAPARDRYALFPDLGFTQSTLAIIFFGMACNIALKTICK